MKTLIVVNDPEDWPLHVEDVEVVAARNYLTDPSYTDLERVKLFNLCRSYRYQRIGYYVSLLAEARGHRPVPSIGTIQDLKSPSIIRVAGEELDELIQKSLAPLQSTEFELSVYFGRNIAARHDQLAAALFKRFRAPFLLARFDRSAKAKTWQLVDLDPMAASDIPQEHRAFVVAVAEDHFAARHNSAPHRASGRYDLAILWDEAAAESPSDERAIKKFSKAADAVGLTPEIVDKSDYGRLAEFDALFIRETTAVNHHTFRFARRALAEGLVVVDDPESILKCTNKVFLAEMLDRSRIPAPKTLIVHRGNIDRIEGELGLPCILKEPDSAFSQGVKKVESRAALEAQVDEMLEDSELIVAQEFVPTEFDWRIGVFDRQPIFACRYFMATRHWQIIKRDESGKVAGGGRAETVPIEMAPTRVVKAAVKAANAIGDGLYGVDVKQVGDKVYVIEVNDNPNIDGGIEDAVLKDDLYMMIMRVFLRRIENLRKGGGAS